jgi:hypothetical protein
MLRALPFLLALALAACSDREIGEERPSRRHLAAEWCEDWCTFWHACEPILHDVPVSDCQERCEGDEAWDWTDACGDIIAEYRDCLDSLSCEEARDDPEIVGVDDPCQPHLDEFLIRRCTYDRAHDD